MPNELKNTFAEFNKGNTYSIAPIEKAIDEENIRGTPLELPFRSLYQQESRSGKDIKTSNQGAVGHAQIKPSTFNGKGISEKGWDINNPVHNLRAGIRYLKEMNKRAEGDIGAALAGYNAGPKGIKAYKEGKAYTDLKNPHTNSIKYADTILARVKKLQTEISNSPPIEGSKPPQGESVGFPMNLLSPSFKKLLGIEEAKVENINPSGS